MEITHDSIRAAGGIVHSDGNIFFRDISMLQGLINASLADSVERTPAGWQVWWGMGQMRPCATIHATRGAAEAEADRIRSCTEIREVKTAPGDERAAFEAWFSAAHHDRLDRNMPDKSYNSPGAECAWSAWQARAALASPQQPQPR